MRFRTILSLLFLHAALSGRTPAGNDGPLKPVTFTTLWLPQAQFAGYLVAQEKGFYRDAGLDLKLLHGGPNRPPAESLASGKTDIAMMFLFKGIEQRASGVKLVDLAQMNRHSALMLVAKKASGIQLPRT